MSKLCRYSRQSIAFLEVLLEMSDSFVKVSRLMLKKWRKTRVNNRSISVTYPNNPLQTINLFFFAPPSVQLDYTQKIYTFFPP